jgi:ribosomal protein L24
MPSSLTCKDSGITFHIGDTVRAISGPRIGKTGVVSRLYTEHGNQYLLVNFDGRAIEYFSYRFQLLVPNDTATKVINKIKALTKKYNHHMTVKGKPCLHL